MPTTYHMVHYRKFTEASGQALPGTLEKISRDVLSELDSEGVALWGRIDNRVLKLGGHEGRQLILNKVADLSTAVFGEMCLVDEKGLQSLLELKASKVELSDLTVAEVYDLHDREAPKGSQFIRGMAYWLAVGNHLLFVKTNSLTPEHIREYLDWLLKSSANGLPATLVAALQAEFDPSQVAGDIGDIKNLRVKGVSAPQLKITPSEGTETEVATSRKIGDRLLEFEQALPVVRAIFGPARAESLVESLGPKEYLAVDASVKVRGRRTEKSKAEMKKIANDLADTTEAEVRVEGKDGKISDGDAILRTRMPFHIENEGSSLLDFNNVADQLQEVYSRFVLDGKIEP